MRTAFQAVMRRSLFVVVACSNSLSIAALPYTPVVGVPAGGSFLPSPSSVPGKNFSHFLDRDLLGLPDPEQNVAFDGLGGVLDGRDYSGTRLTFEEDQQVDALANHIDALFRDVRDDRAYLLFSVGNGSAPVGSGSILTSEAEKIGRAGDLSYESIGSKTKGVWAVGNAQLDGDPNSPPVDVDGLEVWGPEPRGFDEDRYSLTDDSLSGVSVWNGSTGAPYISQSTIISAVTSVLGDVPGGLEPFQIDLDALMVLDTDGEPEQFGGVGDSIIFSIRQLMDPNDTDGFYATGSELFTLDASAAGFTTGFLKHGGHLWDHKYTLAAMKVGDAERQLDINAIEAVATVPEPGTLALMITGVALAAVGSGSRRRRASRLEAESLRSYRLRSGQ